MAKQSKILMIPFTYHFVNMMDYYDMSFSDCPNNRSIIWDTVENHRVWQPSVRTYQRYGESGEDFVISQTQDRSRVSEFDVPGRSCDIKRQIVPLYQIMV